MHEQDGRTLGWASLPEGEAGGAPGLRDAHGLIVSNLRQVAQMPRGRYVVQVPSEADGRPRARDRAGSGLEVERKFLIAGPPNGLGRCRATRIEQGYVAIDGDGTEVRLRRAALRSGAPAAGPPSVTTLTVKSGAGRVRAEEELEIDPERFTRLWSLTEGRRLEKTRYELPAGPELTIELDVYAGPLEGLVTAEVEFPSAGDADAFAPPEWFGPEITDDRRYSNQRLAAEGAPAAAEGRPLGPQPPPPVPAHEGGR